jgi:mannose-1-phosphate guanylyltransferase
MEVKGVTVDTPRKAFLMAAGSGTRLKPLTDKTPKCLLPLGGQPMLHWWLKLLEEFGVQSAIVNTHHLPDQVRAFVRSRHYRVQIRLFHEPKLLGSAGTIAANRNFINGEESFWIFYADTLIADDLSDLLSLHKKNQSCLTLGLFSSPDPSACGIVELDSENRVCSFEEKPKRPRSNLSAAGVYLASSSIFQYLPSVCDIPLQGLDLGKDIIPQLVRCASGIMLKGPVMDMGTLESYKRAQREWFSFGLAGRFEGNDL